MPSIEEDRIAALIDALKRNPRITRADPGPLIRQELARTPTRDRLALLESVVLDVAQNRGKVEIPLTPVPRVLKLHMLEEPDQPDPIEEHLLNAVNACNLVVRRQSRFRPVGLWSVSSYR